MEWRSESCVHVCVCVMCSASLSPEPTKEASRSISHTILKYDTMSILLKQRLRGTACPSASGGKHEPPDGPRDPKPFFPSRNSIHTSRGHWLMSANASSATPMLATGHRHVNPMISEVFLFLHHLIMNVTPYAKAKVTNIKLQTQ